MFTPDTLQRCRCGVGIGQVDVGNGQRVGGAEPGVAFVEALSSAIPLLGRDDWLVVAAGDRHGDRFAVGGSAIGHGNRVGHHQRLAGGEIVERLFGGCESPACAARLCIPARRGDRGSQIAPRGRFGRTADGGAGAAERDLMGDRVRAVLADVEVGEGDAAVASQQGVAAGAVGKLGERSILRRIAGDDRRVVGAGDDDSDGLRVRRVAAVLDGDRIGQRDRFTDRQIVELAAGGREGEVDLAMLIVGARIHERRGEGSEHVRFGHTQRRRAARNLNALVDYVRRVLRDVEVSEVEATRYGQRVRLAFGKGL